MEEGDKCDLEPVMSFSKVHAAHNTVKSFMYAYRIGRGDELKF
jgi:hypothetical protein